MNISNNKFMNPGIGRIPLQQPVSPDRIPAGSNSSNVRDSSFGEIFKENIEKANGTREVRFSKHAMMRLQNRRIDLNQEQMKKISDAVDKAEVKGVRDSLVLMDKLAMVVNVKSRTVITAVNSDEMKENVFTNIDGAVIV